MSGGDGGLFGVRLDGGGPGEGWSRSVSIAAWYCHTGDTVRSTLEDY